MKAIKIYGTMLIIALFTIQANAQLKVVTGGNVGIGTALPTQKLEVFGNQLISGNSNKLFFGNTDRYLGFPSVTQDFSLISKNSNWMRIGSSAGIAFWGGVGAENNSSYHMFLNSIGLGIGNGGQAWGSYKLVVYGNGIIGNNYLYSDNRFKNNIKTIENSLDKVLKLNGREYYFNKEEIKKYSFNEGKNIGFIAQEIKEILPELVSQDKDGFYCVNYTAVIPVLVEAIKEQQSQIEELKEKLQDGNVSTAIKDLDNLSTASLSQNNPNPFTEKTEIKYLVPENANQSSIFIYNMNGVQIKEVKLTNKGNSSITINGSELEAGMYLYALIVDGKELDTKRMILTK